MDKSTAKTIYNLYHSSSTAAKRAGENMLIEDIMPLIRYVVHEHLGRYDEPAIQEAAIECLKALKTWDPAKTTGNPASYFHFYILHGADSAVRQETGMPSVYYHRQLKKLEAAGLTTSSSIPEIMNALNLKRPIAAQKLKEAYNPRPVSLDALKDAGRLPTAANAMTPEDEVLDHIRAQRLKERLKKAIEEAGLSENHAAVIIGVFDGKTIREIAEELDLTKHQVSYMLILARKACRGVADDEGIG